MAELRIKSVAHDVTGVAASAALEFQTRNCLWENVEDVCKEHEIYRNCEVPVSQLKAIDAKWRQSRYSKTTINVDNLNALMANVDFFRQQIYVTGYGKTDHSR